MKDKIFKYTIPTMLIISLIGYVLIKTNNLDEKQTNLFEIIYKITLIIGLIFILYKSTFIKEKFNLILKTFGILFLIVLGMNLLTEFELIEINVLKYAPYFLIVSLLTVYLYYFMKKTNKTQLDYLKVAFISTLMIGTLVNSMNLVSDILKYATSTILWLTILVMLFKNPESESKKLST
ncbi:hypothetical protein BZARG_1839 [Bizionia argentinensis JUB59]|uniref:Uncharacterized protein n=1 Tax=Bizionia argentinensis JUB59 TaxID=1046627 RepID=G2EG11_9FLAO|nr:hypothetical protein [Bizionia argentinensis]EGV42584.1 hypothetical protein BZARG_1839 [Bizionia argentinensis JUB59]